MECSERIAEARSVPYLEAGSWELDAGETPPPARHPTDGEPSRLEMDERPYITCRELIGFLHLYLAGELEPDRRAEFDRHLAVCPSCVAYIESYQRATALGRRVFENPDAAVDDSVPEELVSAILEARRKE
jgi:anti-sigma factor RsiW